jgi:hypothetical protein
MRHQINKLKSANAVLTTKLTNVTDQLERKKKEVNLMKKTAYLKKPATINTANMQLEILPANNPIFETSQRLTDKSVTNPPNLLEVAKNYKERLDVFSSYMQLKLIAIVTFVGV